MIECMANSIIFMKKILILFVLFIAASALKAQNVQLHYDIGKDRKYLTSTVEMFKPDKWGSTFFFIDMDYGSGGAQGVSTVSYTHLRAHETRHELVCRLLLEKKKKKK